MSIQTLTRHDLRTIFRDVWVVWVAVTNWTGYKVLDQNVATSSSASGFCMKPLCAVWAVPSIGKARLCHAHPPLSRVVMTHWWPTDDTLMSWNWVQSSLSHKIIPSTPPRPRETRWRWFCCSRTFERLFSIWQLDFKRKLIMTRIRSNIFLIPHLVVPGCCWNVYLSVHCARQRSGKTSLDWI